MSRRFKIKTVFGQDDPRCMGEVITRRLKHSIENPNGGFGKLPDAIFADGGITQIRAIKNALKEHGYENVKFRLRNYNPPVMNRISAFNARVKNSKGERHLFIDPRKCKWILYNIYNLSFKEGTSIVDVPTHIQIKSNREAKFLEHPFDAVSYLVEYYWGLRS